MFKNARRTAARWGNTLLAMLGLGLASPVPPTYGYQRQRDTLPKEVQNDRMIAAQERRERRGLRRRINYIKGLRNYAPLQNVLRAQRSHARGNDVAAGWDVG